MRRALTIAALLLLVLPACGDDDPPAAGLRFASPAPSSPSPEASSPAVRFTAVADAGTGDEAQAKVIDQMCKLNASLPFTDVVQAGDNVYDHGDPADIEPHFVEPFACLFEDEVEFHSVLGNHDVETDGGAAQLADARFGMPARNFTWSLGPVSFVMLDTNVVPSGDVLSWLDDRLAAAEESPWTVVVFHHPPFSPGTEHGSSLELRELLATRFSGAGVDLVINGHEHLYGRAEVDGVTYIVTGGGGRELTPCLEPLPKPYAVCRPVHEFVEFEATRGRLVLTAHTSDGATIESHEVPKNP